MKTIFCRIRSLRPIFLFGGQLSTRDFLYILVSDSELAAIL